MMFLSEANGDDRSFAIRAHPVNEAQVAVGQNLETGNDEADAADGEGRSHATSLSAGVSQACMVVPGIE